MKKYWIWVEMIVEYGRRLEGEAKEGSFCMDIDFEKQVDRAVKYLLGKMV